MRSWLPLALLGLMPLQALSAEPLRAVTEDGRKVLLSEDGRWKFDAKATSNSASDTGSPYQSLVKRFSVSYDTSRWVAVPTKAEQAPGRQMFRHRVAPVYALIMADEIPAQTEAVKEVILLNAVNAGGKPQVLIDEIKDNIGYLRFASKASGVDFMFANRYYGDDDGNIQVACFTGQQLFHKYEAECARFLAGLTIR